MSLAHWIIAVVGYGAGIVSLILGAWGSFLHPNAPVSDTSYSRICGAVKFGVASTIATSIIIRILP
jgi:hypothetical protein